jgi:hypothetical protein
MSLPRILSLIKASEYTTLDMNIHEDGRGRAKIGEKVKEKGKVVPVLN